MDLYGMEQTVDEMDGNLQNSRYRGWETGTSGSGDWGGIKNRKWASAGDDGQLESVDEWTVYIEMSNGKKASVEFSGTEQQIADKVEKAAAILQNKNLSQEEKLTAIVKLEYPDGDVPTESANKKKPFWKKKDKDFMAEGLPAGIE